MQHQKSPTRNKQKKIITTNKQRKEKHNLWKHNTQTNTRTQPDKENFKKKNNNKRETIHKEPQRQQ